MQELDQTQELIQMLKERLNEKDETIATLHINPVPVPGKKV